jgi:uncharacterized membrane protein YhaH (DUF805 family)
MNEFKMYFLDVIKNKYATFNGRARRSEFWFFSLFYAIINTVLGLIWDPLTWIFCIATIIPGFAITARRLHDINKSGWCQLLFFIPIVNIILIFVWLCKEGDHNTNEYGANPKA